jgi:LacI family transcriptional regulator
MVCESNETYEREVRIVDTLLSSRVGGILVSVSKETRDSEHFRKIQQAGVPIVFFDRVRKDIDTDKVVVDDEVGAFNAVDHLLSTGRRRIALLGSEEHLLIGADRQAGYIRALERHGIPADATLMTKCDTPEQAEKIVPELLAMPSPPDAFYAVNDLKAAVALRITKQFGYKVPEEVAVVGFTNGQISALTNPTLSSVEQFGYEMGKIAVQLLIDRLTAKTNYPRRKHIIETKLVIKDSSGKKFLKDQKNPG